MVRLRLRLLRWKMEGHEWLEALWEGRWFGVGLTGIAVAFCIYLQWNIQNPGVSVAFMGVAAALMTARAKATGPEKFVWMLIITSLLLSEVLAIRKDHIDTEVRLAKLLNEEVTARAEAKTKFGEIGNGITGVVTQSQAQFNTTVTQATSHFNATMGKTQESVNNLTGGNSYPMVNILPIPLQGTVNTLRLVFSVVGKHPLYDVSVSIRELPLPKTESFTEFVTTGTFPGESNVLSVPSISPGMVQVLWSHYVTPEPNKISDYQIVTFARNGKFTETLHVRKSVDIMPGHMSRFGWEESWEIKKKEKIIKSQTWQPILCGGDCVATPP